MHDAQGVRGSSPLRPTDDGCAPLDLQCLAHADLTGIRVHGFPCQPEQLAWAQTEHCQVT
ncbi:MAG: hypothetical protein QOG44_2585 [Acidimicrobiaceae bacterium]|nr:hypothetical protein [Acidimicrobiaceae bacterium]